MGHKSKPVNKVEKLELAQLKEYLDMKDVILMSGFSQTTIRRKIDEGILKPLQQVRHGKLLFKKSNIERWLDNGAI
jgi:predicted DNA-binding transcriptional regulator AlpA